VDVSTLIVQNCGIASTFLKYKMKLQGLKNNIIKFYTPDDQSLEDAKTHNCNALKVLVL
jgi:hypothetical protein